MIIIIMNHLIHLISYFPYSYKKNFTFMHSKKSIARPSIYCCDGFSRNDVKICCVILAKSFPLVFLNKNANASAVKCRIYGFCL